jgi:ribosome-binding factor A
MASERRIERVNKVIAQVIAQLLHREYFFGEGVLVTITKVQTRLNMTEAEVYFTVLPEGHDQEVDRFLQKHVYEIQQSLNRALPIRPVPKLVFKIDKGQEMAERVYDLLGKVKHSTKKRGKK